MKSLALIIFFAAISTVMGAGENTLFHKFSVEIGGGYNYSIDDKSFVDINDDGVRFHILAYDIALVYSHTPKHAFLLRFSRAGGSKNDQGCFKEIREVFRTNNNITETVLLPDRYSDWGYLAHYELDESYFSVGYRYSEIIDDDGVVAFAGINLGIVQSSFKSSYTTYDPYSDDLQKKPYSDDVTGLSVSLEFGYTMNIISGLDMFLSANLSSSTVRYTGGIIDGGKSRNPVYLGFRAGVLWHF